MLLRAIKTALTEEYLRTRQLWCLLDIYNMLRLNHLPSLDYTGPDRIGSLGKESHFTTGAFGVEPIRPLHQDIICFSRLQADYNAHRLETIGK